MNSLLQTKIIGHEIYNICGEYSRGTPCNSNQHWLFIPQWVCKLFSADSKCFLVLILELLKFREDSMQHERQMCPLKKKRINYDLCWKLRLMPMGKNWDNHRAYLNINFPSYRIKLVAQLNIKPCPLFARDYSRVLHCNQSHSVLWFWFAGLPILPNYFLNTMGN